MYFSKVLNKDDNNINSNNDNSNSKTLVKSLIKISDIPDKGKKTAQMFMTKLIKKSFLLIYIYFDN